jgi:hypothetical protein
MCLFIVGFCTYQNPEDCHLNSTGEESLKTFYQPCLFISILQLNSDEIKVERDVDVVGEEDCTDTKMEQVYRPSVLCIKTEHEVSIVI